MQDPYWGRKGLFGHSNDKAFVLWYEATLYYHCDYINIHHMHATGTWVALDICCENTMGEYQAYQSAHAIY